VLRVCCFALLLGLAFSSCKSQQRKNWSIAIAVNNSKYDGCASLLRELFAQKGLELEILRVPSSVEAVRLVAEGQADFTLSLSHSDFILPKLGNWANELRTVIPMFENALFIFYRTQHHPQSVIELVEKSKIFLEVPDSLAEQYIGLQRILGMLNVVDYEFVNDSSRATMIPIWGTFSGELTRQMLTRRWNMYSMEESFIDYALIIEPRFGRLTVPIRYTGSGTKGINTLLSTAFLISGAHVDRTDLYDIISMMYDNRVFFTSHDKSYMAIRENFSVSDLNFPLHTATSNYLKRNEPTFLERHAEFYGFVITILILVFGIIQSLRNYITRKKKDRIDLYFQEYLRIMGDSNLTMSQRIDCLETLRAKAIQQMVLEKLDISDFSVFDHTIESDRLHLRQGFSEESPKTVTEKM
jgi:TRAP-type uncharacterized transport system substrate-binding protein